ncbi:MAG: coproporphyrinogen III oxidase, partial [Luteimonas sp.]|nr:coproporphyrinogen III oxidase [Luteimonas sp.]
ADALGQLQPLQDDGLVRVEPGRISATTQGRLLLRNIAMCFDRYLPAPDTTSATPRFSRAI